MKTFILKKNLIKNGKKPFLFSVYADVNVSEVEKFYLEAQDLLSDVPNSFSDVEVQELSQRKDIYDELPEGAENEAFIWMGLDYLIYCNDEEERTDIQVYLQKKMDVISSFKGFVCTDEVLFLQ